MTTVDAPQTVTDRAEGYKLRSMTEREDGSIVGEMVVATVGPMTYPHGVDYVPRETLEDVDAIESLKLRPIIGPDTHTPDKAVVQPHEIAERRIGHVGSNVRMEGDDLVADYVIDTPEGKALIAKGLRGVSPGYTRILVKPVDVPVAADYAQRDRRYLHVALVPTARGGERTRITDSQDTPMDLTPEQIAAIADACVAKLAPMMDGYMAKMADAMKPPAVEEVEQVAEAAVDAAPSWTLAETRRILDLADDRQIDVTKCATATDAARLIAAKVGTATDASVDTLRGVVAAAPLGDGWKRNTAPAADTASPSLVGLRPAPRKE
jgi:hypothetical protein